MLIIKNGFFKGLLDVVSPFYSVVKADYEIVYDEMGGALEPEWIKFHLSLQVKAVGALRIEKEYQFEIVQSGISQFVVTTNGVQKTYSCEVY